MLTAMVGLTSKFNKVLLEAITVLPEIAKASNTEALVKVKVWVSLASTSVALKVPMLVLAAMFSWKLVVEMEMSVGASLTLVKLMVKFVLKVAPPVSETCTLAPMVGLVSKSNRVASDTAKV